MTVAGLEADLEALVAEAQRAPLPLVRLEIDDGGGLPVVRGRVLTERQRRQVEALARPHQARVELEVIADPELALEEAWLESRVEVLDMWRDPGLAGDEQARQTQYIPGDGPLRRLGRQGAWSLVQGPDLTIGWCPSEALADADAASAREAWGRLPRASPRAAVLTDPRLLDGTGRGGEIVEGVLGRAREALGTPYLWGGTTPAGYDCSGLLQRVLRDATGVLLPKHTGDQRHVGARVAPGQELPGDLFATLRGRRVGHVMLMTARGMVLHACRTENRVIEEPIAENAQRYQPQGFRRPVLLHAPG